MTDPDFSDQPEGATPIDDASGLKQPHIQTIPELNKAETLNIVAAEDWIRDGRIGDVFQLSFYRGLHRRMLDDVWEWAGDFRVTNVNIGEVPYWDAPMRLQQAGLDFEAQIEADIVPFLEFIATYHHRLVWVHPFKNGNGRWARLACDAMAIRLRNEPPVIWATGDLVLASEERSRYIAALRAADQGDISPLTEYLADLNPDRI
jgi:Fic-DOC domain mobile mystery protein B